MLFNHPLDHGLSNGPDACRVRADKGAVREWFLLTIPGLTEKPAMFASAIFH
jgi:hypothetical protein